MNDFDYLNDEQAKPSGLRDAWLEINLGAIEQNIRRFKALVPDHTEVMAIVKANGYGHGAAEVAFAATTGGATRFGVATPIEALSLREAGIVMPILLLSEAPQAALNSLLKAEISLCAASKEYIQAVSRAAQNAHTTARIHMKINTGMNRIGFKPREIREAFELASALPHIEIEGTFTHFATADVLGDWEAAEQLERFKNCIEGLRDAGFNPGIVHAANTAATILIPQAHFDMVRVGIGMYGLQPSADTAQEMKLEQAMTIRARCSAVFEITIGDGVSYGLTWHSFQKSDIATLPLGYADGIPRLASNNIGALVRGTRVEGAGRICMDQMMFEIPHPLSIEKGEEFVLSGAQGDAFISLDALADAASTNNYEIACALGSRLERVYVR